MHSNQSHSNQTSALSRCNRSLRCYEADGCKSEKLSQRIRSEPSSIHDVAADDWMLKILTVGAKFGDLIFHCEMDYR